MIVAGIEKVAVGGTKGGQARKEQMASEHGGDASAGYSEMGHQVGRAPCAVPCTLTCTAAAAAAVLCVYLFKDLVLRQPEHVQR